jgi:hypothetical protein
MGGFNPNPNISNKTQGDAFTLFDPFSTEASTSTKQPISSGLSGLDDIFNTKSSSNQDGFDIFNMTGNTNQKSNTNNTNSIFDTDIFGNGTPVIQNNLYNNSITNNNDNNFNVDLFGGGFSSGNTTSMQNEKVVFTNNEMKITCKINKESPTVMNIIYFLSNTSPTSLTNIKMTFSAPKLVTVKVNSTSGYTLDPNQNNGITKELSINNDSNKQVVLKFKLSYNSNGQEIKEESVQSDFQ